MLSDLRKDGIVILPQFFGNVCSFISHLLRYPVYNDHVRQGKNESPLGSYPWMCHDMHDVTRAPGWLETAITLTPLAREYLAADPLLFSLNAFYYEPNATQRPDTQEFHRDADDVRFLALFVYLTDVLTDEDGPHQFQRGTQNGGDSGEVVSVYGERGTMFLADTRGLHRGLVPRRGRRAVAWARWGVTDPPPAYVWDGLRPLDRGEIGARYPDDGYIQRVIRLVVS